MYMYVWDIPSRGGPEGAKDFRGWNATPRPAEIGGGGGKERRAEERRPGVYGGDTPASPKPTPPFPLLLASSRAPSLMCCYYCYRSVRVYACPVRGRNVFFARNHFPGRSPTFFASVAGRFDRKKKKIEKRPVNNYVATAQGRVVRTLFWPRHGRRKK